MRQAAFDHLHACDGPVHFQVILDRVNALQPPHGFLGQLLLVIRIDYATQDDVPTLGFEMDFSPLQVGVVRDGGGNQRIEGHVGRGHVGGSHLFEGWSAVGKS